MSYSGYNGSLGYNSYKNSRNQKCCCPSKGDGQGTKGTKGDKGPKGVKGEQGIKGQKGEKGQMEDLSGNCFSNYIYWDTNTIPNEWKVGGTTGDFQRVHIGCDAGTTGQGEDSIAIGHRTATTNQSANCVAIGVDSGNNNQGEDAVAIGNRAGQSNQTGNAIAIGVKAGNDSQGLSAIAIGDSAGEKAQRARAIAIGDSAGATDQSNNAIAIGSSAGSKQQAGCIAIGPESGVAPTGTYTIAIGGKATGQSSGQSAIAIGTGAGSTNQTSNAIAIGSSAGSQTQGGNAIAIGERAGNVRQLKHAIAIGTRAGEKNQQDGTTAVGYYAGNDTQSRSATAIGFQAGEKMQSEQSVSVGYFAGNDNQKENTVSVGVGAGYTRQNENSVAIGPIAGAIDQSANSVAVGYAAGYNQKSDCIAIGRVAGFGPSALDPQNDNTIVLNATGGPLNSVIANGPGFYAAPIRQKSHPYLLNYDAKTEKEITFFTNPNYIVQQNNPPKNAHLFLRNNIISSDPKRQNPPDFFLTGDVSTGDVSGTLIDLSGNLNITGDWSNPKKSTDVSGLVWDYDPSGNIAIGDYAGVYEQNGEYINGQDGSGVAIGFHAGQKQGSHSIAIGCFAGEDQSANTIILNATGQSQTTMGDASGGFYVKPVRQKSQINALYYDTSNGEITYNVSGGGTTLPSGTTRSEYLYWDTSSDSWEVDGDQIHIGTSAGVNQGSNSIAIGKNAGASQPSSNSIAIGENAGENQGDTPYFGVSDMIAIGGYAGLMQGLGCVALGGQAGRHQTAQDIAIGLRAGENQGGTTNNAIGRGGNNIAIGCRSGNTQNKTCIAIGFDSGVKQGDNCISIGWRAGASYPDAIQQANNSIILNATGNFYNAANSGFFVKPITNGPQTYALYYNNTTGEITYDVSGAIPSGTSGTKSQYLSWDGNDWVARTDGTVAIGDNAEAISHGISIGLSAGSSQDTGCTRCISIGSYAGQKAQNDDNIAIGLNAGRYAGNSSISNGGNIAIGYEAGINSGKDYITSGPHSNIAIGFNAGSTQQTQFGIAIGHQAGDTQDKSSIAIGTNAGRSSETNAIAIGNTAGYESQNSNAIAIGNTAGYESQSQYAIAVGRGAGQTSQGQYSIAIGDGAGFKNQGENSIAIGRDAGRGSDNQDQSANTIIISNYNFGNDANGQTANYGNQIIINASGNDPQGEIRTGPNPGFFVKPVSEIIPEKANSLFYNNETSEIFQAPAGSMFGTITNIGTDYGNVASIASEDASGNLSIEQSSQTFKLIFTNTSGTQQPIQFQADLIKAKALTTGATISGDYDKNSSTSQVDYNSTVELFSLEENVNSSVNTDYLITYFITFNTNNYLVSIIKRSATGFKIKVSEINMPSGDELEFYKAELVFRGLST